jgi:hypothetical protein
MTALQTEPSDMLAGLLPNLQVLQARVTLRLLQPANLPAYKGGLLRGGFGFAFQRATCPEPCWGRSEHCPAASPCPFRQVFEPTQPLGSSHLHDLQDVPRAFVLDPPLDERRTYTAGEVIEFGLTLIGHGVGFLPHFIFGFKRLAEAGLGSERARARLERVELLAPFQPVGTVVYQDGRLLEQGAAPTLALPALAEYAATLSPDLNLTLRTPLRVKSRGMFIETVDVPALVQAACWRIDALATIHGEGPWERHYKPLVEAARTVVVERAHVRWEDWERTSTRRPEPQRMKLGGIVGGATLRGVPPELRAVLLAASFLHVGKACVFGHGRVELAPASFPRI